MTAITLIIALILGAVWYDFNGRAVTNGVSIYEVMFLSTLLCAVIYAIKSYNNHTIYVAAIIVLHTILHQILWNMKCDNLEDVQDYVFYTSVLYSFFAFIIIKVNNGISNYIIALLFLFGSSCGFFCWSGILPTHLDRPKAFLALSYPDLIAFAGHLANVTLGISSGDSGPRLRKFVSNSVLVRFNLSRLSTVETNSTKDNKKTKKVNL